MWWKVTLAGDQLESRKDLGFHAQAGERGGEALSAGSITFCGSLAVDPVLDRLVMNFLDGYR